MKKSTIFYVIIFLAIVALNILSINSNATTITLYDIVEKINDSKKVEELENEGINVTTTYDKESITITVDDITSRYELNVADQPFKYTEPNTILTSEPLNENISYGLLLNAIGRLYGYEDGELYDEFNNGMLANEHTSYDLKDNGIEFGENNTVRLSLKRSFSRSSNSNSSNNTGNNSSNNEQNGSTNNNSVSNNDKIENSTTGTNNSSNINNTSGNTTNNNSNINNNISKIPNAGFENIVLVILLQTIIIVAALGVAIIAVLNKEKK